MNTPGRRAAVLLLAKLLPLGLLTVAVAVPALEWAPLPARVADHWGLAGHPNGSDPKAVAFAIAVGLAIIGAGLTAVGGRLAGGPPGARLLAVGLILAGVGAALSINLTVVNLGVSRWQEARQPVPAVVALVVGPLALGGAAMSLARRLGLGAAAGAGHPPDRLGLGESERAFWLSRASNNWALPLAVAGLVAAATVGVVARWEPAVVIVVVSVPGVLFGSVSVGVSAAGGGGPLRAAALAAHPDRPGADPQRRGRRSGPDRLGLPGQPALARLRRGDHPQGQRPVSPPGRWEELRRHRR